MYGKEALKELSHLPVQPLILQLPGSAPRPQLEEYPAHIIFDGVQRPESFVFISNH